MDLPTEVGEVFDTVPAPTVLVRVATGNAIPVAVRIAGLVPRPAAAVKVKRKQH